MGTAERSILKFEKLKSGENEIQMSHATDSTCECLVEHHASNELVCLNLRGLLQIFILKHKKLLSKPETDGK